MPQASWPRKKRLEANPSQPPPGHLEGLCGARTRRDVELDGLRYEGCRQHRYEGPLSGILPGYG